MCYKCIFYVIIYLKLITIIITGFCQSNTPIFIVLNVLHGQHVSTHEGAIIRSLYTNTNSWLL
jgi:hypothetical protein